MGFIFGIIAFVIIILIETILSVTVGFTILGLYMIIIPLGALILGGLIGWMISIGIMKSRGKITKIYIVFAIVIGLLTVPTIYAADYLTTYVDSDGYINKNFEGTHISNFSIDDQEMSYVQYTKYTIENSDISLKIRRVGGVHDFESNPTLNYVLFFLNNIAVAIAAVITMVSIKGSSLLCEKCNEYYKRVKICQFDVENYENVKKEIIDSINYKNHFAGQFNMKNMNDYYYADVNYCKQCFEGYLSFYHMKSNDKDQEGEINEDREVYKVEDAKLLIPTKNKKSKKEKTKNKYPKEFDKDSNDAIDKQTSSSYDELIKLKELLDLNVINQEDYDAKKKKILEL